MDSESFSNSTNDQADHARNPLIIPAQNLVNAFIIRFQKRDDGLAKTSMEICLSCLTAMEAPKNPTQRTH